MIFDDNDREPQLTENIDMEAAMAAEFGDLNKDAAPLLEKIEEKDEKFVLPSELHEAQIKSVIESVLFASVHPISFASLKGIFHGTDVTADRLRQAIDALQTDYAGGERGIELSEASGGYQLRTKLDNAGWLKKTVKARPFRLSGPALEVLSIIAYKQPIIKAEVDQIRGVESGHLVRALMEKNLVRFAGKSELPGKPMLYGTTKEFLELFGLRNIRELPTLSEIDELIPEGIGDTLEVEGGETLGTLGDKMGLAPGKSYSESESELLSITEDLTQISTSSEFFEQEKIRERQRRDQERAQDLRERKIMGEELAEVDAKWLTRFEAKIDAIAGASVKDSAQQATAASEIQTAAASTDETPSEEAPVEAPIQAQDQTVEIEESSTITEISMINSDEAISSAVQSAFEAAIELSEEIAEEEQSPE
jgi:segregation and condensation protein B